MVDTTQAQEPIVVRENAGTLDAIQAVGRYVVVLITFGVAIAGLAKKHDIADMITYVQQNGGQVAGAISGLIMIGTAAYGVFKSGKRGSQIATVASSPSVPDEVATTK